MAASLEELRATLQMLDPAQQSYPFRPTSEHMEYPNPNPTVMPGSTSDPKNPWRDFLCVEKLDPYAFIPTKANPSDAGYDLYAFEETQIPAWESAIVTTKIRISMPPGYYGRIASRSGLATKGIEVGAGVIDNGYRGEILVLLRNLSNITYNAHKGDRIAQLILTPYRTTIVKEVKSLSDLFGSTDRQTGGFGSSGK